MPIRTEPQRPRLRRAPKQPDANAAPPPDPAERDFASKARAGSARLRLALLRYGAKHGLPNLTPQQCAAALQWLEAGRIRRRKPARSEKPRLPAKAGGRPRGRPRKNAGIAAADGESGRHGTRR